MGTGELPGAAHPGLHGAQHGLHVQGLQHVPLFEAIPPNCYLVLGLEEVILVDHTSVGQRLEEAVGQGSLAAVGHASDAHDVLHLGAEGRRGPRLAS